MTRSEAVAVTAHDALVAALMETRRTLILLSARFGRGVKINGVPLANIIERADIALAMAEIATDSTGKADGHAA